MPSRKPRYPRLGELFARFGHVADERELLEAVRAALTAGLPERVVTSRVRLGAVHRYGGGFMSDLVAGVEIHVPLVLKSGDEAELIAARELIERANASGTTLFANTIGVRPLSSHPGNALLVMEELTGFTPLLHLVYSTRVKADAVSRALRNATNKLAKLHAVAHEETTKPPPYLGRLRTKLKRALKLVPSLRPLWSAPGRINGVDVGSAASLLRKAERRFGDELASATSVTVHGDPHLGNMLARPRGRNGQEVLFIDPKPFVGPTDRVYDYGKLFHWLEPLGWWATKPERCVTRFRTSDTRWSLVLRPPKSPIERRRAKLEHALRDGAVAKVISPDETARLHLATASAHIGLAGAVDTVDATGEARVKAACGFALLSLARSLELSDQR